MKATFLRQRTDVSTPQERNAFEQYSEAVSVNKIIGDLLKFAKGDYTAGQEEEEIPEGTELVSIMDELRVGYVRWQDGRPVEFHMGRVVDKYVPPRRIELGDNDPDAWEIDNQGRPRDPWRLTNSLILKDPEGDRIFTFVTASKGGLSAVGELAGLYGRWLHERPDEFPIIALRVRSYKHRNKAFGKIFAPMFEIVGWVPKAEFTDALAAAHQGSEEEEPPTSSGAPALNGRDPSAPTVDTRF